MPSATMRRPRRAERKRPGAAAIEPGDLKRLREAWKRRELVLFLGAGLSIPYGLPTWKNFVLQLLFEQARRTKGLGRMWPHYRHAVASWMTDYFEYDPLVLARVVEQDLGGRNLAGIGGPRANRGSFFLRRLRAHLYANDRQPAQRTTLRAVAELIAKGGTRRGVDAVVSFNFDDLLERELRRLSVDFLPVVSGSRQHGPGLRVIHAHGYIPQVGPISGSDIVFTEPDYHRLTESIFHWSLSEVVDRLRKRTVLFVGLSMSDPSLRRLLDASRNSRTPPHWQIQKRHEIRDHEVREVMEDVERRARKYAIELGSGLEERKQPRQLEESIKAALRQADAYDQEVFESMGVRTIWVDEFDQIPDVIDAIAVRR